MGIVTMTGVRVVFVGDGAHFRPFRFSGPSAASSSFPSFPNFRLGTHARETSVSRRVAVRSQTEVWERGTFVIRHFP
jgi:hypothetical protein